MSFFGGTLQQLSRSAEQWQVNRTTNSAAKDKALTAEVAEISPSFPALVCSRLGRTDVLNFDRIRGLCRDSLTKS